MRAVPDPRCGRESRHDHAEVLVCLVAGFLSGRTTVRRCLKWCRKHLSELRKSLLLKNGIASPSTVCRLLSGIDEELFALEFMEWIGEIVSTKGLHIAIDGKALRAAMEKVKNFRAPMILNAIDAATGLVVAQMPIPDKESEIMAVPELLKLLDIRGSTITTDAIGTQTRIMEQILSQEGHFVLMVKRNQPQSYDEITKYFGEMSEDCKKMKKDSSYKPRYPEMQEKYKEICQAERNRDRQEYRWYSVCTDTSVVAVCVTVLTAVTYRKRFRRILMEAGIFVGVCLVSFPMVYTIIRTVPAVINDPVRYDLEFTDRSFMIYEGDPIDSDKYMTVRRFFTLFFGRFQTEQGMAELQEEPVQEDRYLVYAGTGRAGANLRTFQEDSDTQEQEEEEDDISNGRFKIFQAYLKEMRLKGHPKMGPLRENGEEYAHAHNSYLQVAYNFGMIAGAAFLCACALVLWRAVMLFYRQGSRAGIYLTPFALIVAFGFMSLTEWAFHPCIPAGFCFILMQVFLIKE